MALTGPHQAFSGVVNTRSLEEHQEAMSGTWRLRTRPLAMDSMHSRLVYLGTRNVLIYREQWTPPVHIRGELCPGRIAFGLPASSGVPFSMLGRQLEADVIPWMAASGELDIVTRRRFDNVVMVFDERFLRRVAAQVDHSLAEASLPQQPIASSCPLAKARSLRRTVESVLAAAAENPGRDSTRAVSRDRLASMPSWTRSIPGAGRTAGNEGC